MAEKSVATHYFVFGSENGGEALTLNTEFFGEDGDVYVNQVLTLNSYGNSASFNLFGTGLHPDDLRKLANELDRIYSKLGVV